jgi:hypothetical protein
VSIPTEGAGKGDIKRPTDRKKYDENWVKVFGKVCLDCTGRGWRWNFKDVSKPGDTGITMEQVGKRVCPNCSGLGKVDPYEK